MGTELQFQKKTLFKCFPRTQPKSRFGGCGAVGNSQHELYVLGCRMEEVLFHISHLWAPMAKRQQWFSLWQPSGTDLRCCGAHTLSACLRRQFSVCSLFSVVGFAVQPCILFWRRWGLWQGTSWWKGDLPAQTRSQKTTNLSALGLTLILLQFLLRSCSLARRSFR